VSDSLSIGDRFANVSLAVPSLEAIDRPSRVGAKLSPDPITDFSLHSSGSEFLDGIAPTATTAKFKDFAGLKFAGGNPWKAIETWSMSLP
jgi:hypothetical protein